MLCRRSLVVVVVALLQCAAGIGILWADRKRRKAHRSYAAVEGVVSMV